jgi:hypothetical protein
MNVDEINSNYPMIRTPSRSTYSNPYKPSPASFNVGGGFKLGTLPGLSGVNLSEFGERRDGARHNKFEINADLVVRGGYENFGQFTFGGFASMGGVIPSRNQQAILNRDNLSVMEFGGRIEAEFGNGRGLYVSVGGEGKRVVFEDLGEQDVLSASAKLGIHAITDAGEGALYIYSKSVLLTNDRFDGVTLDDRRTLFIGEVPVFEFETPLPSEAVDALPVNRPLEFNEIGLGFKAQFNRVGLELKAYGHSQFWFGDFGENDTRSADNQGGFKAGLTYKLGQ